MSVAQLFYGDRNRARLSIAHYIEMDSCTRLLLSNFHLQLTGVAHVTSVDFGDHVADPQTGFCSWGIRFYLRHDRASRFGHLEELGVLGSDVRDSDSHVSVGHLAVANQSVHRRPHDLRRNGKSHSGKGAGWRNEEGVDTHDLAASIDQRPAGIPFVNSRIGLDEFARLAAISGIRICAVQSTHNAA